MSATIQIYCKNTSSYIDVEGGYDLLRLAERLSAEIPFSPICARVNNKTENLSFRIFAPKMVEFLPADCPTGERVYIRSLCMMLYKAVSIECPDTRLSIEHSVSHGYFCRLYDADGNTIEVTECLTDRLLARLQALRNADIPFTREEKLTEDVKRIFAAQGLDDKVLLLDTTHEIYTTYYTLNGLADSYYGPLAPSTASLQVFNLIPFRDGMLLLGFDPKDPETPRKPVAQEKMFDAYMDYRKFNKVIKVSNVGELNSAVKSKRASDLINVAEAMHDKVLGRISDEITRRNSDGGARVVLIAGPSSSGKTTYTKRLAIQLMTNLMTPKMISLDDYFVNREDTPLDSDGEYDYESLYALDLDRFNSDLSRLLEGDTINLPTYSFELGRRVEKERPLHLDRNDVLLIEGIHGLNPELVAKLPPEEIYKIYVSALTTLSIDDHNWISTTDNRLLRRIVRDNKYRHTTALDTIRRWPSVRRGEERWIFPFQENADATFNSSLIFELGVMKPFVTPLLHEVPHSCEQYAEAYRLLRLLGYFEPIPDAQIPSTSLLREFLGGSSFHY